MMLKRIESENGQRCVEVFRRDDGAFQFREGIWTPPWKDEDYEVPDGYWSYLFVSGIYSKSEDAECEATAFLGAVPRSIFRAGD